MTYEEALEVLKRWKGCRDNRFDDFCKQKRTCIGCEYEFEDEEVNEAMEVAIEALEKVKKSEDSFEWCTDCKEYDKEHYRCNRWNKCIRETVKELRGSTMWIPCNDMLPKFGQQVLCCNDDGRVFTSCMYNDKVAYDGTYIFGQHWGVIAWMPLPKPYKEVDWSDKE